MSNSRQLQFSISDLIGFTIACSLLAFTIHALPRDSTVSVIAIVGMLYSTKFFINLRRCAKQVRSPFIWRRLPLAWRAAMR